ncbi:DUF2333 family protein [Halomonas sp. 18H]|nr:DUF2333 family protein [Halomonas sp. 18H]MCW4151074.1 DUF2333 family protein [Halomonas sp. 18H]
MTGTNKAARRRRDEVLERPQYGWTWKPLLVLLVLYLIVTLALGVWWSRTPAHPLAQETPASQAGAGQDGGKTVDRVVATLQTLLDKPGGYLGNDIAPPGVWLDNMPAWELGVLRQTRGLVEALPSLLEGSSEGLTSAAVSLRGNGRNWLYPSTEHHLRQAIEALEQAGPQATSASGGLATWLGQVAEDLDNTGVRLSASVGDRKRLAELGIAVSSLPEATSWYRVDNIFFEARGQAWALRHLLTALRQDHQAAIEEAGLSRTWEALMAELERSQRRLWSPLVLNGSGFGIFANHSLVMASHVLKARDLVRELADGLAADRNAAGKAATASDAAGTAATDASPKAEQAD